MSSKNIKIDHKTHKRLLLLKVKDEHGSISDVIDALMEAKEELELILERMDKDIPQEDNTDD